MDVTPRRDTHNTPITYLGAWTGVAGGLPNHKTAPGNRVFLPVSHNAVYYFPRAMRPAPDRVAHNIFGIVKTARRGADLQLKYQGAGF